MKRKGKSAQTNPTGETNKLKPRKLAKKLLITLLIPFVAVGIHWFSKLPEHKKAIPLPMASQSPSPVPVEVTPSPIPSLSPAPLPQTDPFQQAVNQAMSAATLTQSARSQVEWNAIISQWQEAIELMKAVPDSSLNYQLAQKKVSRISELLGLCEAKSRESLKLGFSTSTQKQ